MPTTHNIKEKALTPRSRPSQRRSIERQVLILETTAKLLDEVGFDDLTTILVARKIGMSVGTLYHYYPNKQAILYALAQHWLQAVESELTQMSSLDVETMTLKDFVDDAVERTVSMYRDQRGILPLVQAMFAVPELRELDDKHDEMVIKHMSKLFLRFEISKSKDELNRIARAFLELTHALTLVIINQPKQRAQKTMADLKFLSYSLLCRHRDSF